MSKRSLLAASIAMSFFIGGCANNPELRNSEKMTMDNVDKKVEERAKEMEQTWATNDPAVVYFDREKEVFVTRSQVLPTSISNKKIYGMTVAKGTTLQDIAAHLYPYKVNLMFGTSESQGEEDIANLPFSIKNYTGTVGGLLSMIEGLHNISFNYIGENTIKAEKQSVYIASMPSNEEVLESVKSGITSIGAESPTTDLLTGSLIYKATNYEQRTVVDYLDRFYENYAGIKMQVTVLTVSLDETLEDGFNWGELDVVLGSVEAAYSGGPINNWLQQLTNQAANSLSGTNSTTGETGTSGGTTGTTSSSGSSSDSDSSFPELGYDSRYSGSSIDDIKSYGWFKPEGLDLGMSNKNISVNVIMDWLNQYGSTRAEQSAFLETITGKETEISSQKAIPYIESESTTLQGQLSPVATQNTETAEKTTGIKVVFTPFYDSSSQEVMVDLDILLKNLVGYTELTSANGNEIKRPDIQTQKFPTTVRMKVGETKLLGGVIYDTVIESRTNPNVFSFEGSEYIEKNMSKSAMFVLLRPTVQLFRQTGKE
jgi:hypothetical protein